MLTLFAVFFALGLSCTSNSYLNTCDSRPTLHSIWMGKVPDKTKLTELSLPGTHDSGSIYGGAAPAFVKTHSIGIKSQLNAGVRYLDIRLRHFNNGLPVHHGQVYMKQSFTDVLKTVKAFLEWHTKEVIFMRIKEEYTASGNTNGVSFADLVQNTLNYYLGSKLLAPSIYINGKLQKLNQISLGQVRGRLIVLGQDGISMGYKYGSSQMVIQDSYTVANLFKIPEKKEKIKKNMDEARKDGTKLYLNHLSGVGAGMGGISQVAKRTNKYALEILGSRGKGLGIIAGDFLGGSLITDIIKRNAGWSVAAVEEFLSFEESVEELAAPEWASDAADKADNSTLAWKVDNDADNSLPSPSKTLRNLVERNFVSTQK